MDKNFYYFDYNATAPQRPEIAESLISAMESGGNPSSIHDSGRKARKRVESGRDQVAAAINAHRDMVIFTSGATEAANTILKQDWDQVLISAVEHVAIKDPLDNKTLIPVDDQGLVDLDSLKTLLGDASGKVLVCVQYVNNETGVIQTLNKIVQICREHKAHLLVDAAQALGRIKIDFAQLGADFMILSAHKIGGPQGCGAIIKHTNFNLKPLIAGGGQEKRARAGTENVPGIVGFGQACELVTAELDTYQTRITDLRDQLWAGILATTPNVVLFGENAPRVANTLSFALPGTRAETMLMNLDLEGIAISSGAACSSGSVKPSHVLQAMNISDDLIGSALRISIGHGTTQEDIDYFLSVWRKLAERLRT